MSIVPRDRISGRVPEMGVLEKALKSPEPEFVAIYGRRRVGKTFLVREFFGDSICFELTGLHNASLSEQLDNFAEALGRAIGLGVTPRPPRSWQEAFAQLERFLESSQASRNGTKRVVFLDELPWLDTRRAKFCSALEHFWNTWASRRNDLILVVCGSAASWMIQNVVRAKGGLHNRVTRRIRLLPFTLAETEALLQSRGVELTRYQIVELYMVLGGVPHYLREAEPGLSTAQIVDRACFSHRTGLRKPDAEAYRAAAHALGVGATEIVFVDDKARNLAAAASVGMGTAPFRDADDLEANLVGLGLLEPTGA